jgi:NAD(P)-dependent dehydrogenase (short-subunit alcohol dehydrogenase family)
VSSFSKFDLGGRTALVTGAASGIGYHMARALADAGARVLICARRAQLLEEAAARLAAECPGAEIVWHPVDLADRLSIATLASYANDKLGGVDIFIANAAQNNADRIEHISDETVDYMLQMNVAANIQLFRSFLPTMRSKRWGRVIFISSVTTLASTAQDGTCVYVAAKGALNALARNAAAETGHDGITVNSLVLGMFLTEMVRNAADMHDKAGGPGAGQAFIDSLSSMTAIGRPCRCEEIEGVIQLLASDAGAIITGTNIPIDGGMSIMLRPNPVGAHA